MTMRQLTILVDLDDIVVDLQGPWYREYNLRTADTLDQVNVTDWDVSRFARWPQELIAILSEPGFFSGLPALPGAIEGLRVLVEDGHRVLIVSAGSGPESLKGKGEWVEKHLRFLPPKNLILTHAKDAVRGDVLFDDGPRNLTAYRAAWPDAFLASIEYPYNAAALRGSGALRVGAWTDPRRAWHRFVIAVRAMSLPLSRLYYARDTVTGKP
jgi:5'(3')-deoxyribonucleotidase